MWLSLHHQMANSEVGMLLKVSPRTVDRILLVDIFLSTGDVKPLPKKNGPDRTLSDYEELLVVQCIIEKPSTYLYELQNELVTTTGTWVDCATICRTLKRLGFSHKKIRYVALQQSEVKRLEFMAEVANFKAETFVWLDESGFDRKNLMCKFGYNLRGMPPQDHTLKIGGKRYSSITVMSMDGVLDIYLVEGSVNGDVFMDFTR